MREKRREQREAGYITVFVSLLLGVMLVFVCFVLEASYLQLARTKGEIATSHHAVSMFGDYHQATFDRYHLLVLDTTYQTGSTGYLEEYWSSILQSNLGAGAGVIGSFAGQSSVFQMEVEEMLLASPKTLMDNHMEGLKSQIETYCVYGMTESLLAQLKERAKGQQNSAGSPGGTDIGWQYNETAEGNPKTVQSTENPIDPREYLNTLIGPGLLPAICELDAFPSGEEIDITALPSYRQGIAEEENGFKLDFVTREGIWEILNETPLDMDAIPDVKERVELVFYMRQCFSNYAKADSLDHVLTCEQEYILYGHDSDKDNLLHGTTDIILIRMPFNYMCFQSSETMQAVLDTTVAALAVLIKVSPEVLKTVLTVGICYAESILDMRALLQGERIPLVKKESDWQLNLKALFKGKLKCGKRETVTEGLSYEDYLSILCLLRNKDDDLYYRLLDVVTLNMRKQQEGYDVCQMIVSGQLQYRLRLTPRFSGILYELGEPLYTFYYQKPVSYLEEP